MPGAFQIRQANHADVAELRGLIELSVRHLQQNDYTPAQIEGALGHALGLDTQLIEDRTYFAAVLRSQPDFIVGCGGWSYRKTLFGSDHGPNRHADLLDPAREPAKIRAIFVHPEWARQGLGTLILKHCESDRPTQGDQARPVDQRAGVRLATSESVLRFNPGSTAVK